MTGELVGSDKKGFLKKSQNSKTTKMNSSMKIRNRVHIADLLFVLSSDAFPNSKLLFKALSIE